jgi:hypothetical protein
MRARHLLPLALLVVACSDPAEETVTPGGQDAGNDVIAVPDGSSQPDGTATEDALADTSEPEDATPDATAEASPEDAPLEADAIAETAPDAIAETAVDAAPETTPDATPETTPDAIAEVAVDAPADVVAEVGSDAIVETGPNCGPTVSYARDVRPILQLNCAGCHNNDNPRAGLPLTATRSHGALVGVDGNQCSPRRKLVAPGDSRSSYLIDKLTGQNLCGRTTIMPPSGKLRDSEIDTIRAWICQGAKDD